MLESLRVEGANLTEHLLQRWDQRLKYIYLYVRKVEKP